MEELLDTLTTLTGELSGLLWGNALTLGLLLGTGLYLTIRLRLIQVRGFGASFHLIFGNRSREKGKGEVSYFQALSTALSATVGTGNIAGVATAISLGGPGALFWMWVTAVLGMATKFTECTLAVKFREIDPNGEVAGGPMYTLLHGLKMRRMAIAFAAFAMIASFGIGNMVQANSVVDGIAFIWPELEGHGWTLGVVMSILVGLVIIGGLVRIAKVASALVPFMAALYIGAALIVLFNHSAAIPAALARIFNLALNPWAVGGAAVGEAIRWGVARGLFSNESGLGSAPIAYAATKTNEPVRVGLVSLMGPFIDTLVICTMTGLVIIVTGAYDSHPPEVEGAALTSYAFSQVLGQGGAWVVGIGLALFAYSTTLGWSYYGDRSAKFLFGERAVLPYRVIYTMLIIVGAAVPLRLVWNIADITNLLMALPNIVSLLLLAGLVSGLTTSYFARQTPSAE